MAESKVQYIVEVSKTGSGGQQAAAELQAVANAARTANAAASSTTASLASLQTTTKTTSTIFRSLGGVIQIAGFQQFPQLTAAALVTQQALNAVRSSGVALTANVATVGAGVVGLAAALVSAGFAWAAYRAEQEETASQASLMEQSADMAARLRNEVVKLREEAKITDETFGQLVHTLGSAAGNDRVRDFLRSLERGNAGEKIAEFNRNYANEIARRQFQQPQTFDITGDLDRVRFRSLAARGVAQDEYNRKLELYNQLLQDGLLTEQQADALSTEADTARIQRLTQINAEVEATKIKVQSFNEIVKMGAEQFAGGLASTLVDVNAWTKDAGKAFSSFFSNLTQSIAQAIVQAQILKALSFLGLPVKLGAEGGVFPRLMATGGIQTVSSPTYFPRFNVVAGEAGSEMLAVLSRPRFMNLGGVEAAVGSAQGNRLAITSADALAARGAGGTIVIEVRGTPDFEARVVNNSVQGAVVRVTRDVNRNTALREAVRKA